VASQSSTARKNQADAAQVIVEQVVSDWERRVQVRQVAPTIKALRAKMRMGFEAELQKSLRGKLRDLDSDQRLALAKMLDAGIARILHEPITRLRQEASRMEQEPLASS